MSKQSQTPRRVVVTGLGSLCGLGNNRDKVWSQLISGKSGVQTFTFNYKDKLPTQFGGQVNDFQISDHLISPKEQPRFDRFIHFAVHAANEALEQAQVNALPMSYPAHKRGCILGVGMGGFPLIEENYQIYTEKGAKRVTPFFIPSVIPNMAPGLISIVFQLKGINYSISSACASSGHAIMSAAMEIAYGNHDMMITGGSESVLSILPISGFSSMKALSKQSEQPALASRPFDKNRDGFIIGEGAGVLVLESLDGAIERQATIYAELAGWSGNSDAHHITAPHPEGDGASECMKDCILKAGLRPEDIDYVNAHGTSTPLGDIAETKALKKTFGSHAHHLLISSTKSMTGHLLGAAGGIESVFCVQALHHGIIPPTINLHDPDPECDLNYVPLKAIKKDIRYALNNTFGFGGTNASLIFKKYEP
jgi:3-oxoacyl-[acyl-carrier-protein] synthase II